MKRITIEDVAQATGVSRQTVSRAINDKGEISQDTKDRVLEAVQKLGYRPNRLAQSMITHRTHTIGFIIGDITNPFFPEVTRGIQDIAQANDYNVFLCNTDDKTEVELQMLNSLAAQGVDGIILFSHQTSEVELKSFADTYRPLVLINRIFEHPNVSVLMVDNFQGGQLAADNFAASGHSAIGVLTNDVFSTSKIRRLLGFKQRLSDHGLKLADNQIVMAPATLEGGYEAAQRLLTKHPTTTAIYTYNDLMALGAIRACGDQGRRIPEDVAIIGFDDIHLAKMTTPSLSSVHVDKYAIGQEAVNRLLKMIDTPDQSFPPIELGVELILRETT